MKKFKIIIFIVLYVILFGLLIFSGNITEHIQDANGRLLFCSAIFTIALIIVIFDMAQVVRERKYKTTVFIVIVNIVMIITIVCAVLLYYKTLNTKDLDELVYLSNSGLALKFTFLIGMLLNSFLRTNRFVKKSA